MKKIMFICTGNTCRSPMAMAVFNSIAGLKLPESGYEAVSAGLAASGDAPPSTNAVLAMRDFPGTDITRHRAHTLREAEIEEAFLVLTMTRSHKNYILSMFPWASRKVFTLKEYAYDMPAAGSVSGESPDIADPYGSSLESYKLCAREIALAVGKVVDKLGK